MLFFISAFLICCYCLRSRKICFQLKLHIIYASYRPWGCGALALLGAVIVCRWAGQAKVPTTQQSAPKVLWLGPRSSPTATRSHQHFSWGWQVPQGEPSLCPYTLVSCAVGTAMNRDCGRQSSHLQDILVCPQSYWTTRRSEGTHITSEGAINAAKFSSEPHLVDHQGIHTCKNLWECNEYVKSFRETPQPVVHLSTHWGDRFYEWECEEICHHSSRLKNTR